MIGNNNRILLSSLVLLCLAGCGKGNGFPPRAAVSGTVSLDGKPLERGIVRFVPMDGTPGSKWSVPVSAGSFSVQKKAGPTIGRHRIEIESRDTAGFELDDEDALASLASGHKKRIKVIQVPPWYGQNSPLQKEVTAAGPNEFEFMLTTRRPSTRTRPR